MHQRRSTTAVLFSIVLSALVPSAVLHAAAGDDLWSDVTPPAASGERLIVPERQRTLALDRPALEAVLDAAPRAGSANAAVAVTVLVLPLPDGGFGRFRIEESPVMAPALAARFPAIRTFRARGIDAPTATGRLDLTPHGFHAMVRGRAGTLFIDPYQRSDLDHYLSYWRRDLTAPAGEAPTCHVDQAVVARSPAAAADSDAPLTLVPGDTLRTYRLAVAATGEYTGFHGGTVPDGMAAIVTAINRVNEVYENDVAIFMELIADNDLVVYTNGATDPFTNNNGFTMLGQNQTTLDAVIGDANYDIGHVFSTGGGGIAALRVPCRSGLKAQGVTGLSNPTGDPFYIDFVAHEMGHQWGGNHSFNGSAGACGGGNRNPSTAYEPGSGSTIMAYAGICGPHNLQPNSDPYFHVVSLNEIIGYSTVGAGNGCAVPTATGNLPPSVDAGDDHTIPINTPFALCGAASDPDGDAMAFAWEQWDLGPAGHPNFPSGNAPIFRSFNPVTTGERLFPKQSDLLDNVQTIGERLPTYSRGLTLRLTARDNAAAGGGYAFDDAALTVSDVGDGFAVTSPNTAVSWSPGAQTVTWNVGGTTAAPILCATVDIQLSLNGGLGFPITLVGSTANDGSASVTVPDLATASARIRVRCHDNVFFDVSNADFTITGTGDAIYASNFERCEPLDDWADVVTP